MKIRIICIAVLAAAVLQITGNVSAETGKKKYVLLLNSYHKGYRWSDDITEAVEKELRQSPIETVLFVEYMDTKKIHNREYLSQLPGIYRLKYRNYKFDAVICSDNNALDFMAKFRKSVFPGVPVVFCGINAADTKKLRKLDGFTGVTETPSYSKNLELVMNLHPKTENIVFITDSTLTGKAISRQIKEFLLSVKYKFTYEVWDNKTIDEIKYELTMMPAGTIVFLSFFFQDRAGRMFEYYESASVITSSSPFPVYSFWDFNIPHGVTGGSMIGGFSQGAEAAKMAISILKGKKPQDISIVAESPSHYIFDYNQIKKFGIDLSRIPEGSSIINMPESLYSKFFYIIWATAAVFIFMGAVIGLLTFNIVRRKKSELLLRKSRDRLKLVIESTQDSLWDYYPSRDILILDENWKRITGYMSGTEGWKISDWQKIVHSRDLAAVESAFTDHMRGKSTFIEVKYRITAADGSRKWIMTRGRAVERKAGEKITRLTGTNRDITEMQNREQQILQMQKTETIATLASGLAHDFNNILTGISGTLYLVKKYLEPGSNNSRETLARHIDSSTSITERAAAMTKQLLNLSRKDEQSVSTFDLRKTLSSLMSLLSTSIDRSITIHLNTSQEEANVTAEESRIEQILLNICINAAHSMTIMRPRGAEYGGDIIITLREFSADELFIRKNPGASAGTYWIIEISDTGVGIDKENISNIFKPFFTTKEKGLGTGLGLSMAYDIIRQYEGFMNVYSEPGKGTNFYIYLPKAEPEGRKPEEEEFHGFCTKSCSIIMIDDEEIILSLCRNFLEQRGFSVKTASNGKDGIELFKKYSSSTDAVYIDMVMPVFSGNETFAGIRKIDPSIPVIISTGLRGDRRLDEFRDDPNITILYKPFSMSQLARAIQESSRTESSSNAV